MKNKLQKFRFDWLTTGREKQPRTTPLKQVQTFYYKNPRKRSYLGLGGSDGIGDICVDRGVDRVDRRLLRALYSFSANRK